MIVSRGPATYNETKYFIFGKWIIVKGPCHLCSTHFFSKTNMNSINFILCHQNQTRSKDMDLIESVTIQLLRKEKILSKIVFQDYEHLS